MKQGIRFFLIKKPLTSGAAFWIMSSIFRALDSTGGHNIHNLLESRWHIDTILLKILNVLCYNICNTQFVNYSLRKAYEKALRGWKD